MGRVTRKYYGYCPLVEDFHIQNVIGGREKRQIIFGANVTATAVDGTKDLTLSGLTGGLITHVDHYQVLVQGLQAPTLIPRVKTKIADTDPQGFTIIGDAGNVNPQYYSVIVFATLPSSPKATSKWAKDYCPGCKNLDFWAIIGSIYKDVALFNFRVQRLTVDLDVKFRTHTVFTEDYTTDLYISGEKGSSHSPLVSLMAGTDYQVIVTPSDSGASTYPAVTSVARDGFTLGGDNNEYYNILVLGQVTN